MLPKRHLLIAHDRIKYHDLAEGACSSLMGRRIWEAGEVRCCPRNGSGVLNSAMSHRARNKGLGRRRVSSSAGLGLLQSPETSLQH